LNNDWTDITPDVNSSAEFFEIVNDFGDPLELIREAISNAIDWEATYIKIKFDVKKIDGYDRLVVYLEDNGVGMHRDVLSKAFWGLGHSEARKFKGDGKKNMIGEKGHGTKIYLRSEKVLVKTKSDDGIFESVCERPYAALSDSRLHTPKIRRIPEFLGEQKTGTQITIIGYNDNEQSIFTQERVTDYINWFTKAGSIEKIFEINENEGFEVHLQCLDIVDTNEYKIIKFGHYFPDERDDIDQLIDEKEYEAAEYYVKRFIYKGVRLKVNPKVTFDLIVSVEGDRIKRHYNKMIQNRTRKETGKYKVSDRYGLWVCKDYIPIIRVNDWISGFGTGSNSLTMVHGFLNCQKLSLTANRGAISNTDSKILDELKERVQEIFDEIDINLKKDGIYQLRSWQKERKTVKQEAADFKGRIKSIKKRKKCEKNGRVFLEPRNEAETFGLFISIYSIYPEKFIFEPLDYNTSRGIDLIGRNKTTNQISESEFWYVELKFILGKDFNHAFKHLRWILCWDFAKNISDSDEFIGVEEIDVRYLKKENCDDNDLPIYFLDKRRSGGNRIEIIRLKEFLKLNLEMDFE